MLSTKCTKFTFVGVVKIIVLITIASLAYKTGHFSEAFIPSPFQMLFLLSLFLTFIHIFVENKIKDFFNCVPKNIFIAIVVLFVSIIIGWVIAYFFLKIPLLLHAFLNFGTFTMSMIIFFIVYYYSKDDNNFAKLCLYALLIPNYFMIWYFFTHGYIGYWGVPSDRSLDGFLDPNIYARTLLVPSLFFITGSLFSLQSKKWLEGLLWFAAASFSTMLVFWTISRGGALGLVLGAIIVWLLYSFYNFSWKKIITTGIIIILILSFGYNIVPHGVTTELEKKIINTGTLPIQSEGKIQNITKVSKVTMDDLRKVPRMELRIIETIFFSKYAILHPLGIGPNASYDLINSGAKDPVYLHLGPDNTYLLVWLWGGLLGILSFLYILFTIFGDILRKWKVSGDRQTLALIGILFSLLVAIGFEASLATYCFFIVLALSMNNGLREKDKVLIE